MENDQVHFTTGFEYKGLTFGWIGKKLFRLPGILNNRQIGLRKLPVIIVGNKRGYRLARDRKTIDQALAMTDSINVKVNKSICRQCK
jgi:hypothetical protein